MTGADETLLFATDHLNPDFDPPEEVFQPASAHLEDGQIRGIMSKTVMDVFEL